MPEEDGTLRLAVPEELRHSKVHISATLTKVTEQPKEEEAPRGRGFGAFKGKIVMAPDFDAPLDDFKDYRVA